MTTLTGKLNGKTALITGGNSGIGLETARRFIAEGAKVIITGRREAAVKQAAQELGPQATGLVADVSDLKAISQLYQQVQQQFGKLDILFANAGISELRPISEVDEALYDRIMDTNVKGLFFTVQKALPLLNDGASVIFNASVVAQKGFPNFSVYAASKAAVRSLARSLTADLKDRKIRINSLSPGPIATPIYDKMGLPEAQQREFSDSITQSLPHGQFGQPQDIAAAALYLASDESRFVTGIDLQVDGGLTQI